MMSKTVRLIDPDTGKLIELDFPHSLGSPDISDAYKCIVEVSPGFAYIFNLDHLQEMSAFESTVLLEYAIEEFKLAFSLDSQKEFAENLTSACSILLEWAVLYPYGVWSVT